MAIFSLQGAASKRKSAFLVGAIVGRRLTCKRGNRAWVKGRPHFCCGQAQNPAPNAVKPRLRANALGAESRRVHGSGRSLSQAKQSVERNESRQIAADRPNSRQREQVIKPKRRNAGSATKTARAGQAECQADNLNALTRWG